jgi:hypothetical protein
MVADARKERTLAKEGRSMMVFSRTTLRELRDELGDLQQRRDALDRSIVAIELIVSGARPGEHASGRSAQVESDGKNPRGSLRHSVLEVLRATSGSNAIEVTKRLDQVGFRVGGTTSLRQRVSHELSRLRRLGIIRKRRNRKYVLNEVPASDGPTRMVEPADEPHAADS